MRRSSGTRSRRIRAALIVLAVAAVLPTTGLAHVTTDDNGFADSFDSYTPGPLPAFRTSDRWQVSGGTWNVTSQTGMDAAIIGPSNKILVQTSNATSPDDAIAFVRALDFREVTAQVTAAFVAPANAQPGQDPPTHSTLCVVFRSPITDNVADRDNLYLFCAIVTGVTTFSPTGKGYQLFKRIGRTYFPLTNKLSPTWDDLYRPHQYKIVMGGGRIQGYVDGRLVIEHTDIANGDLPTPTDQFPSLPWESGAVGVRTSAAAAWFDDFIVVGNDAADGRAAALTTFAQYGNPQANSRRGLAVEASNLTTRYDVAAWPDTGYVYHDHDPFSDENVAPFSLPGGPTMGAELSVKGADGVTTATARLGRVRMSFSDPGNRITIIIDANVIEATATASCDATGSTMALDAGEITIIERGIDTAIPDKTIGPFTLNETYGPNTLIRGSSNPVPFAIIAHVKAPSSQPHRVLVSALRISIPEGPAQPVPGGPTVMVPGLNVDIAPVAAGRYCP
jgi:hypothetical protein